jgi:serine/threonine protein kinase
MSAPANTPLPEGYLLQNYRIERLLSRGGFSFVYLGRDENEEAVAVKEYMPNALVVRREGVAVKLEGDEQQISTFRQGLRCFFEEGRALAKIDHPNVVRVDNFFRANETVYMVMKYMRGRTLQFHIQNHQQRFNDGFLRRIFLSLLNGLREVHAHKIVHLDIKPANVYINMDGTPVLLDFGAARQILASEGQNLRPLYTAGFAAPEQYHGMQNVGPWSDIYSVGATMYACITGKAPRPADEREKEDKLQPLQKAWISRFSRDLLSIIDWCLMLRSDDRPPSVFALQKALSQIQDEAPAQNVIRSITSRFEQSK